MVVSFTTSLCLVFFVVVLFFFSGGGKGVNCCTASLHPGVHRIPENCQGVLEKIAGGEGGYQR